MSAVVMLGTPGELTRERHGYVRAFERAGWGVEVIGTEGEVAQRIRALGRELDIHCAIFPDPPHSAPPVDLFEVPVPTVAFHIDAFVGTAARVALGRLFDLNIVFHPGFDRTFIGLGAPHCHLLPHAVDLLGVPGIPPMPEYDVAFVGVMRGPLYRTRRRCVTAVARAFKMNDVGTSLPYGQMMRLFARSRIVLNIPRDDYPADANLRCFEAMGSGALLVTRGPSELRQLGFVPGVHYVEFDDEGGLGGLIGHYLSRGHERLRIALAGSEKARREHTYDVRIKQLAGLLSPAVRQRVQERMSNAAEAPTHYWHYYALSRFRHRHARHLLRPWSMQWRTARQLPYALLSSAYRFVTRLRRT